MGKTAIAIAIALLQPQSVVFNQRELVEMILCAINDLPAFRNFTQVSRVTHDVYIAVGVNHSKDFQKGMQFINAAIALTPLLTAAKFQSKVMSSDDIAAKALIEKSAQTHGPAAFYLFQRFNSPTNWEGGFCPKSLYFPENYAKAKEMLVHAASLKHPEALFTLGKYLLNGNSDLRIEKNLSNSLISLNQAFQSGLKEEYNERICNYLFMVHNQLGNIVEKDFFTGLHSYYSNHSTDALFTYLELQNPLVITFFQEEYTNSNPLIVDLIHTKYQEQNPSAVEFIHHQYQEQNPSAVEFIHRQYQNPKSSAVQFINQSYNLDSCF